MGRQCRPYREHTNFVGDNFQSAGVKRIKNIEKESVITIGNS